MSARADAPCYHAYMSEHAITLNWSRTSQDFTYETYNRSHDITFKNGQAVRFSSSPAYHGDADCVDPEEALVAALTSCHMLTFLALASKRGLSVDSYVDEPIGHMNKNASGKSALTRIELRPHVQFSQESKQPTDADLENLHKNAHEACFIANSICADVTITPQ